MEISLSTQPIALRMKNSRSASSGSAYRVNRGRSGCPVADAGQQRQQRRPPHPEVRVSRPAVNDRPRPRIDERDLARHVDRQPVDQRPGARLAQQSLHRRQVARAQPGRGQRQDLHRRHPALMDRRPPQRDRPGRHRGLVEPGVAPHRRPDHPPHLRHGHPEELQLALEVPLLLRGPVRRADRPQRVGDRQRRPLRIEPVHAVTLRGTAAGRRLSGRRLCATEERQRRPGERLRFGARESCARPRWSRSGRPGSAAPARPPSPGERGFPRRRR